MTSTLRFSRWENAAGDAIADASSGSLALGRNLLYNGAMQVAQRGTSATGLGDASSGYHTADRWRFTEIGSSSAVFAQTVEADGPTGSGFAKSLKMEVTTADSPIDSDALITMSQRIEGQDLQVLKKGTADAEDVTLSFWVKSNVTGTYVAWFYDADNTRMFPKQYTVVSADTWELKTITVAGDTTGTFDNDNDGSLRIEFYLAAGSNYSSGTLPTSWTALTTADRAVGQTNLAASTSNYWQITGVQLETGTVATGFDHKPYGVELAECQRYYFNGLQTSNLDNNIGFYSQSTGSLIGSLNYPVSMRVAPTIRVRSKFTESFGTVRRTSTGGVSSGWAATNIGSSSLGFVSGGSATVDQYYDFAYDADAEL